MWDLAQLVECSIEVDVLQDETTSGDPYSDWYIKSRGMCCPIQWESALKEPLLLVGICRVFPMITSTTNKVNLDC